MSTAVSKASDAMASSIPSSSSAVDIATGVCRKWGENGTHFKQGKFSRAETETVIDAIKTYARTHEVSVERLCSEGCHKGDIKGAWITIAECLPERTVQAIYRHGKRQLHGLKRGAWTKEEVSRLLSLVEEHGNRWRVVEQHLGRSADTCRDKYREHVTDPAKGQWTEEEERLLEQIVKEKLEDPGDKHLQGHEKADMQWAEVAKRVGTRNRIACIKKWKYLQEKRLEQRLLSDADSKLSLQLSFVRVVLKTGAWDETEVVWTKLPYPRAQMRWMNLRRSLHSTMPLQEAARTVIERLEQKISQVNSGDPVAVEHKDSPAASTESSALSGSRERNAEQALIGHEGENGLRRVFGAQGKGASGDDQARSRSTSAGVRVNREVSELAPTACPSTLSFQKRSNGNNGKVKGKRIKFKDSETHSGSALQDHARGERLSNNVGQGSDLSDGSSAEVGGHYHQGKREKDEDSSDEDKGEKDGSGNDDRKDGRRKKKTKKNKIRKADEEKQQRSPLQSASRSSRLEEKRRCGQPYPAGKG